MITDISALDPQKTYTYADYLKWQFKERVELIKGKIFEMSPPPGRLHQKTKVKLISRIDRFLEGKKGEVYSALFDVRFSKENNDNKTYTVVLDQKYYLIGKFADDDKVKVHIFDGLEINLAEIFLDN